MGLKRINLPSVKDASVKPICDAPHLRNMVDFIMDGFSLHGMEDSDRDYVQKCIIESVLASVSETEAVMAEYWIGPIVSISMNNIDRKVMSDEIYILMDSDGKRAGMLWLGVSNDQFTCDVTGYLLGIYVEPELRCTGIGSSLLDFAEKWCDERGYLSLTLNVSRMNAVARSLYEKHGFQVQTSVMKKNLR